MKITLNHITKIEGHARLDLHIKDNELVRCELGSIEGSRYFEGLLKGRDYYDVPEITSRICGICSSAHGVAAVMAIEKALGMEVSRQTRILRDLQTIGERIRSHATHLYFLALPDYLGYESALAMKDDYKEEIARALRLVKLGNEMVTAVSGRVMHQVSNWVGGFTALPSKESLQDFAKRLEESREDVLKAAELIAFLEVPDFQRDIISMSLSDENEFATSHGKIKIGEEIYGQENYKDFLTEYHEPYSNANFVVKGGRGYFVGALARLNNNHELLSDDAREFVRQKNIQFPLRNSFHNNLAQAIELIHYREWCAKLLKEIEPKEEEPVKPSRKAGHGIALNEAPRGSLIHEYRLDNRGKVAYANIVTPTANFLRNMQDDVGEYTKKMLSEGKNEEQIKLGVEMLIRAYDPCFSCATHFVRVIKH